MYNDPFSNIGDGKWIHVAVTWNKDQQLLTMFLDGKKVEQKNVAYKDGPIKTPNVPVFDIGLSKSRSRYPAMFGQIKDIVVFESVLDEKEIQEVRGEKLMY